MCWVSSTLEGEEGVLGEVPCTVWIQLGKHVQEGQDT